MPGFVTHYLFGVNSYKSLKNNNLKDIIKNNRRVFGLGLQGPDLFFYFIPATVGMKVNIGNIMHKEKTNDFFHEMIKYVSEIHSETDYEIACAYIHGFMGHYLLDTSMHPYVYGRVGTSTSQKTMGKHYGLETDIDRELLWHYKHMRQADFSHSEKISLTSYEMNVIAKLLHKTIYRTYHKDISVKLIKYAIVSFYMECVMLSDSTELKYKAINGFEHHVFGYDILSPLLINDIPHTDDPCNEQHKEWHNPWDDTHSDNASVYDIFKKAGERYTQYMNIMQTALDSSYHLLDDNSSEILDKLENKSYTSGLDCSVILKR